MWRHDEIEGVLLHWDRDVLVMGSEAGSGAPFQCVQVMGSGPGLYDDELSGAPFQCVQVMGSEAGLYDDEMSGTPLGCALVGGLCVLF